MLKRILRPIQAQEGTLGYIMLTGMDPGWQLAGRSVGMAPQMKFTLPIL